MQIFQVREGDKEVSSHEHQWQAGTTCYENLKDRKVFQVYPDGSEEEVTAECLEAFEQHSAFKVKPAKGETPEP